jgi:hypothetical protein
MRKAKVVMKRRKVRQITSLDAFFDFFDKLLPFASDFFDKLLPFASDFFDKLLPFASEF